MKFTLSILEADLIELRQQTFSIPGLEGAAFALCSESKTEGEHRLLVREIVPVSDVDYLERRGDFLSIDSTAYVKAAKLAKERDLSVIFVHSHPGGYLSFSSQDDREEPKLQEFFASRVPDRVHGGLVLTDTGIIGRVWIRGKPIPLTRIRVVGSRFAFHDRHREEGFLPYFDRQIRAFGPDIQGLLSSLHVGIVGVGGTGSAVLEQIVRLGVGEVSLFDGDVLDESNINRVYGSGVCGAGQNKTAVAADNSDRIGLGSKINAYPKHISDLKTARHLRNCDLVFGCTDKEAPRGLLVQLAIRYLIPVIDMGVKIDSSQGCIRDVVGRVTTMYPGEACLFCRGRISAEGILYESMSIDERTARAAEGYAPELEAPNPAVIPFTSTVASLAVSELLHRLSGFMGATRESTEVMCFFDKQQFRRNRLVPSEDCLCSNRAFWGKGDSRLFLGVTWGA